MNGSSSSKSLVATSAPACFVRLARRSGRRRRRRSWSERVRIGATWITMVLVALPAAPMQLSQATAADRFWDPDANATGNNTTTGTGLGGAGTWNTALLNWFDGVASDVAWNNANNDTAVFAGSGGTVSLS